MLTEYLNAAMAKAHYELLGGGEGFYGEIPGFQGVFAQAETLEACRTELLSTLEDWLLLRVSRQLSIPVVDGLDLTVKESPACA
jgi:predicted RNase H-like HicB family nuclease